WSAQIAAYFLALGFGGCADKNSGTTDEVNLLRGQTHFVFGIACSPNGQRIAAGCADGTILVWDLAPRKIVKTINDNSGSVECLAFSKDGKALVIGHERGKVIVRDTTNWAVLKTFRFKDGIDALAFSPDGAALAVVAHKRCVICDFKDGKERFSLEGHLFQHGVAFSPDGKSVVTVGRVPPLIVWSTATGKELRRITANPDTDLGFRGVGFVQKGTVLATISVDKGIQFFDARSCKLLETHNDESGGGMRLAISPDDTTVVASMPRSADRKGPIWIFDAKTRKLIKKIETPGGANGLAICPDGKTLVSGGEDSTIKLWELPKP